MSMIFLNHILILKFFFTGVFQFIDFSVLLFSLSEFISMGTINDYFI